MLLILSMSLPTTAYGYSFLPFKMNGDIWYQVSNKFAQSSRDAFLQDMRIWNNHIPLGRRLCYNQTVHYASGYPNHDGNNFIYKEPMKNTTVIAENNTWYVNGYVTESDINVDKNRPWVNGYASNAFDVNSVMLHELGHTLGLNHSSVRAAVMYTSFSLGEVRNALHADDVNGYLARYR